MDAKITQLLASVNAQDRKQAIKLLTQIGGQDSLRKLAGIYKNDPDPEVKRLAIEAGKYIKKKETAEVEAILAQYDDPQPAAPSVPSPSPKSAPRTPPTRRMSVEEVPAIQYVFVSDIRQAQAQEMVDIARAKLAKGDAIQALDNLVRAFKTNPNYRMGGEALEMALEITGMTRTDFFAALEDDQAMRTIAKELRKRQEKSGGKPKVKNGKREETWKGVFIEFGIYYAILLVMFTLIFLIGSSLFYSGVGTATNGCDGCTREQVARVTYMVNQTRPLLSYSLGYVLIYSFVSATVFFIFLPVRYFVFHMVARVVTMSFEGTFRGMLVYCGRLDIIFYLLSTLLFNVMQLLLIRDVFDPHFTPAGTHAWEVVMWIGLLIFFWGNLWSISRMMTYYDIGCFQVTCATLLTGLISSWIVAGIASLLTSQYAAAIKAILN